MGTEAPVERIAAELADERARRARAIAAAGGLDEALARGLVPRRIDTTLSEAVVLGLLRQGVKVFVGVFGHGSTEIGEVLRVYKISVHVVDKGVRVDGYVIGPHY